MEPIKYTAIAIQIRGIANSSMCQLNMCYGVGDADMSVYRKRCNDNAQALHYAFRIAQGCPEDCPLIATCKGECGSEACTDARVSFHEAETAKCEPAVCGGCWLSGKCEHLPESLNCEIDRNLPLNERNKHLVMRGK